MDDKKRSALIITASAKKPASDEHDDGPDPREMTAKSMIRAIEDKDYPLFLRLFDDLCDMREDYREED